MVATFLHDFTIRPFLSALWIIGVMLSTPFVSFRFSSHDSTGCFSSAIERYRDEVPEKSRERATGRVRGKQRFPFWHVFSEWASNLWFVRTDRELDRSNTVGEVDEPSRTPLHGYLCLSLSWEDFPPAVLLAAGKSPFRHYDLSGSLLSILFSAFRGSSSFFAAFLLHLTFSDTIEQRDDLPARSELMNKCNLFKCIHLYPVSPISCYHSTHLQHLFYSTRKLVKTC